MAHAETRWESLTPRALEKFITAAFYLTRLQSKYILKSLVMDGRLAYRDRHGRTVIEKSFDRAVRITPRIVLKPPETAFHPEKEDVVIQLRQGASFGTGSHPTTRMALRGIEQALKCIDLNRKSGSAAIDIGTGSGVLGIAAIGLGLDRVVGLDIDACARNEALENARINGFQDQFEVRSASMDAIEEDFDLILANLRLPTLNRILPHLQRVARRPCAMVISGLKTDEIPDLKDMFDFYALKPIWEDTEKGWAAVVFRG